MRPARGENVSSISHFLFKTQESVMLFTTVYLIVVCLSLAAVRSTGHFAVKNVVLLRLFS